MESYNMLFFVSNSGKGILKRWVVTGEVTAPQFPLRADLAFFFFEKLSILLTKNINHKKINNSFHFTIYLKTV